MLLVDEYRCPPSPGPPYSYSCNIACRGVMRHTEIDSNQATIAQLCITIKLHNNTSFETGRESYTLYSLTTHNQAGKTVESRKKLSRYYTDFLEEVYTATKSQPWCRSSARYQCRLSNPWIGHECRRSMLTHAISRVVETSSRRRSWILIAANVEGHPTLAWIVWYTFKEPSTEVILYVLQPRTTRTRPRGFSLSLDSRRRPCPTLLLTLLRQLVLRFRGAKVPRSTLPRETLTVL